MAERRMFAKSIVTSDSFLDMPSESQALYLQLCMAADDDGFVDNPRSIMRSCGASNDAMLILIKRKFVLTFDTGDLFLLVIKHWRVNNYIQKDRHRETKYKQFMRELYYDENNSYSRTPDGHEPCLKDVSILDTTCIQPVSKVDTQYRLDKDSKDKYIDRTGQERGVGETIPVADPASRLEWLDSMIRLAEAGAVDASKLELWKVERRQLQKFNGRG